LQTVQLVAIAADLAVSLDLLLAFLAPLFVDMSFVAAVAVVDRVILTLDAAELTSVAAGSGGLWVA